LFALFMQKIGVRGVLFDNVTFDEAAAAVCDYLDRPAAERGSLAVYTPGSELVQMCVENPELLPLINSAGLVIPDGAGVVMASRILGTPLKQKVAGIDLAYNAVEHMGAAGKRLFLLGARPGVAQLAGERMAARYPGLVICGARDGYFEKSGPKSDAVVAEINAASPDAVFVCFNQPAQERWIRDNLPALPPALYMALGGVIDNMAGTGNKRAPKVFIKLNLEWFYRLMKEPRRIKRMMKLPKFIFGTVWARLFGEKTPHA